jgi:hypothetical protein
LVNRVCNWSSTAGATSGAGKWEIDIISFVVKNTVQQGVDIFRKTL